MLHLLAKQHIETLNVFAASNVLVAFDYDGTLAPITPEPPDARMRPTTRRLLAAVARRYPCVIISDRARADLTKRVGTIPAFELVGSHGIEPWAQDQAYARRVQNWIARLKPWASEQPGIAIEDKTYSLTIHFRHAPNQDQAAAAIHAVARELPGARTLGGTRAISIVPNGAPTKGVALQRVRRGLACDTTIYVGDDDTDEEAFHGGSHGRLLAIRVRPRGGSHANYYLRDQAEIDALLRALLTFRPVKRGAVSTRG